MRVGLNELLGPVLSFVISNKRIGVTMPNLMLVFEKSHPLHVFLVFYGIKDL